ncbi:MAG: penicillin-binding protein activator LpoB [Treponema sp.]|jgi:hypothetical protein|nr:penicillin-binding protein activator LpoB [Treponema sp.]
MKKEFITCSEAFKMQVAEEINAFKSFHGVENEERHTALDRRGLSVARPYLHSIVIFSYNPVIMKSGAKFWVNAATRAVIMLSLAGCATTVPVKSVRMPTINGMDVIKNLGIKNFENKSGVRGPLGAQLTQYLTDQAKSMIPATGKFNIVSPADPNADGVFFGELRSVSSEDTQSQRKYKDKNDNTITINTYTRAVSVTFVYGVMSSRTNMELGTVIKQGSTSVSAEESPANLVDSLTLAKQIVDSQMRYLRQDIVPTIVTANRALMIEDSKDKVVKQLMKTALALVRNGEYHEAIRQYDEIAAAYGSAAAGANANILRQSIESDAAARTRMAQLDSERGGLAGKAAKSVVDALNAKLPSGAVIMVMKTSSMEPNMLNDAINQITTALVQAGRFRVVDRSNQALIYDEQQFQLSGNVDDNSAVSIGHQLGAQYAALCWISGVSSSRKLNLKVLNIETAQITDQSSFDI